MIGGSMARGGRATADAGRAGGARRAGETGDPGGGRPVGGAGPDGVVDLDLGQVRAFVATTERSHFGRAADDLFLTQQAVSRRIKRLEQTLGRDLFVRTGRRATLSDAGRRFLPHARRLLAAAAVAAGAARSRSRPLRIDASTAAFGPARLLTRLAREAPDLDFDATAHGDLGRSFEALESDEIDVAFARVVATSRVPDGLAHRLVGFERVAAAVVEGHPAGGRTVGASPQLRGWGLWWPIGDAPAEMLDYAARLADRFGVACDTRRYSVGPLTPAEALRTDPGRVMVCSPDVMSREPGLRPVRLAPEPLCSWSMVWRRHDRNPQLQALRSFVVERAGAEGWLDYRPGRQWLPDIDRLALG